VGNLTLFDSHHRMTLRRLVAADTWPLNPSTCPTRLNYGSSGNKGLLTFLYANLRGSLAVRPGVSTSMMSPAIGPYAARYAIAALTTRIFWQRGSMPKLVSCPRLKGGVRLELRTRRELRIADCEFRILEASPDCSSCWLFTRTEGSSA